MESEILDYLYDEAYIHFNLYLQDANGNYENLPEYFRLLIKGIRAINSNKIPEDEVYENCLNFPTSVTLSPEVIDFLKNMLSYCECEDVMDKRFLSNIYKYIEFILKGNNNNI